MKIQELLSMTKKVLINTCLEYWKTPVFVWEWVFKVKKN